jgi:hypothetical protein
LHCDPYLTAILRIAKKILEIRIKIFAFTGNNRIGGHADRSEGLPDTDALLRQLDRYSRNESRNYNGRRQNRDRVSSARLNAD